MRYTLVVLPCCLISLLGSARRPGPARRPGSTGSSALHVGSGGEAPAPARRPCPAGSSALYVGSGGEAPTPAPARRSCPTGSSALHVGSGGEAPAPAPARRPCPTGSSALHGDFGGEAPGPRWITFTLKLHVIEGTQLCQNQTATFTAQVSPTNTKLTYKWYQNGSLISGATSSSYATTASSVAHLQGISLTATATDGTQETASGTSLSFTIIATTTPSTSITVSPGTTVCGGANVGFSATTVNGGGSPGYQWQLNGASVAGATGTTWSTTTLNNADQVRFLLNSSVECPTGGVSQVASNVETMTVNPPSQLDVVIAGTTVLCQGNAPPTYTAHVMDPAGNLTYTWLQNGIIDASTTTTMATNPFTPAAVNNGDQLVCRVTTDASCYSNPGTATASLTVNQRTHFEAYVTAGPYTFCPGQTIAFSASTDEPATQYAWFVNGVQQTVGTANTFSVTSVSVPQLSSVTVQATTAATCVDSYTTTESAANLPWVQQPYAVPAVSVSAGNVVPGNPPQVTFTATPVNGGASPSYGWTLNGAGVSGVSGTAYTAPLSAGQMNQVVCTMTASRDVCPLPASACVSLPYYLPVY